MSGMHMKEFSPTVMCAVRTIEVNRYLENMCGLYKEEDSLTVMCKEEFREYVGTVHERSFTHCDVCKHILPKERNIDSHLCDNKV